MVGIVFWSDLPHAIDRVIYRVIYRVINSVIYRVINSVTYRVINYVIYRVIYLFISAWFTASFTVSPVIYWVFLFQEEELQSRISDLERELETVLCRVEEYESKENRDCENSELLMGEYNGAFQDLNSIVEVRGSSSVLIDFLVNFFCYWFFWFCRFQLILVDVLIFW